MNAMSRRQVASQLRLQLKSMAAEGDLPDAQYTVRCKDDKIILYVHAPEHLRLEPHGRYMRYDESSRKILELLENTLRSYQGEIDGVLNFRLRVEVVREQEMEFG